MMYEQGNWREPDGSETPYSDVVHRKQVAGYPEELLLHREALKLAARGMGAPFRAWDAESLSIGLAGSDECVAAVAFRFSQYERRTEIVLGCVHPDHRRKGLYRALMERLREVSKEKGAREIVAIRDINNTESAAMCAALGREDVGVMSRVRLEP